MNTLIPQIRFTKCHGSGNDFVMIGDPLAPLGVDEGALPELSRRVCDRSRGLDVGAGLKPCGADGLLTLQPDPNHEAEALMRMYNPDGSEAELCGNGLRCAIRATMQATGKDALTVRTLKTHHPARKVQDARFPKVYTVSAHVGQADFDPAAVPVNITHELIDSSLTALSSTLKVSALAMPNPHFVVLAPAHADAPASIDDTLLSKIGSVVNSEPSLFPRGGNVSFVSVLSADELFVSTFERGVGLTDSCGSGMTASAIIAARLGAVRLSRPLRVYNKGGLVNVQVERTPDGAYSAQLSGNATFEAQGVMSLDEGTKTPVVHGKTRVYTEEIDDYAQIALAGRTVFERLQARQA